jgi:prophage tail gpP-like protein
MSTQTSTFVVTHADEKSATLRAVDDSQVITLSENPGLEAETVIEAAVEPEPPMNVTYRLEALETERSVPIEHVDLEPTVQATETAAAQSVGELTTQERAGEGEIHVLTVPDGDAEETAEEIVDDEATLARAARFGSDRVEVRTGEGVVSVRYLPD